MSNFAYFIAPLVFFISVAYGLMKNLIDDQDILSTENAVLILKKI